MVCSIGKLYARVSDYAEDNSYTTQQEVENSLWYGKGADKLKLSGSVLPTDYDNAYQGIDRQGNSLRRRQSGRNFNPGRDITLSAPKSVSLLGLVKGEKAVIEAHQKAVKQTLAYIQENCIFTRTGAGGKNHQQTDNAVIAIFQHDDNRNKDPQLHSHCVIFNQTQGKDGKWRSMDNRQLYQQKMTIGMVYRHQLGRELRNLGYELDWYSDGTFNISGYTQEKLIEFSTRKQEIEKAVGIDADAFSKARACINTRRGKVYYTAVEKEALKERWQERANLIDIEHPQPQFSNQSRIGLSNSLSSSNKLIKNAIEVKCDRVLAFEKHRLLREILIQSQGNYQLDLLQQKIEKEPSLLKTNDGRLTTQEAIARIERIITLASGGQKKHDPLANIEIVNQQAKLLGLKGADSKALNHLANNRDTVMLIQGDAEVDSSDFIKALKATISSDIKMRGLVKSATAFELNTKANLTSQTLDNYLNIPIKSLPKNELIVVEQAETIGSKQMLKLLKKGQQTNSRILLIGSDKQPGSEIGGASFRLLQQRTSLSTVYIGQNEKQQELKDLKLESTVDLLAQGKILEGYLTLKQNGKITQIADDRARLEAVVQDYLQRDRDLMAKTLILTGTDREKEEIATKIRENLISQQKLGFKSLKIEILKSKNLDKFGLTQASNYSVGDAVKFGRNYANFSKDLIYKVVQINKQLDNISIKDSFGIREDLKLSSYKDRQVFESHTREIRSGEQMKFTRNQRQNQQINGQYFDVVEILNEGQIKIQTKGKTSTVQPKALLYSDYRYVDTVGNGKSKTANYCIYTAGSGQSMTIGKESFYLAASRTLFDFTVYAASSEALGLSIKNDRVQENTLPSITQPLFNQSSHRPTRNEEFQLLLAAKYLVENQGKINPQNQSEKIYQAEDGTKIKRNDNGLTITQQGAQLKFAPSNLTQLNTFSSAEINNQIQARTKEMNQDIQLNRSQSHSKTLER